MLLTEINYPIFPIRSHNKLYVKDGIDCIDTALNKWQIDNKNLVGETLAARRFGIPREIRYPLTFTLFNLTQLLNYKKGHMFIDNLGNIFSYKKTRMEKLEYHKVIGKSYADEGNCALHVEAYSMPFYVTKGLFNRIYGYGEEIYVGLLGYHGGHLVYDLSTEKKDTTRRKV